VSATLGPRAAEAQLDNHEPESEPLALRALVAGLSIVLSLVALTLLGIACAWLAVAIANLVGS